VLSPKRSEKSSDTAISRVAELEALLARRQDGRQRFIAAFRDEDDPVLIDEIRKLGAEVKEIDTKLIEARKAAKIDEHADRRDYFERLWEATRQMEAPDPDERLLARAKLAQEFHRTIDVITLHGDRHITVRKTSPDGWIDQFDLGPAGLMSISASGPDGTTVRMDASTFAAAFAPFGDDLTRRVAQLFKTRSGFAARLLERGSALAAEFGDRRPALSDKDFRKAATPTGEIEARIAVRQVANRTYEAVLAENAQADCYPRTNPPSIGITAPVT
jgi:hypothetical protein